MKIHISLLGVRRVQPQCIIDALEHLSLLKSVWSSPLVVIISEFKENSE